MVNTPIMSAISIGSALRTPKVSSQYAPNADSERFLDPRLNVCPIWNGQDNLGRQVGAYTFNMLSGAAGCWDPMPRILIENAVERPNYHPYLNTEGIYGEDEDGDILQYEGCSFGGTDTLGVRRDEAFGRYGNYGLHTGQVNGVPNHRTDFESNMERQRLSRALRRKYEFDRYKGSGMS